MVVQVSSASTLPSRNVSCDILTKAFHLVISVFFSRVESLSHIFRCSNSIPEGPLTLSVWRIRNAIEILY